MSAEGSGGVSKIVVNGEWVDAEAYLAWHDMRIETTIAILRRIGAKRIVELGGHPWIMTARLLEEPGVEICATVSAEEITRWPDEIKVTSSEYRIRTRDGREHIIRNYAANVERTLFDLEVTPDTVLACEIIEHLVRAPHVMLLNANRWLPVGGGLVVTTPNGCQFANPFRRRSHTPAYRANIYERHVYLYALDDLAELVTLSGFRVREAGFWDPYQRQGPARVYGVLARLPGRYFREKFRKTLYLVGEKEADVTELARTPRVYDARGDWEFIAPLGGRGGRA
jgi:hypothetical protein